MATLRATQKVLRSLGSPAVTPPPSTTALGDWYVNRLHIGRQPLLLLVSELSLLPMLAPAREVRGLPDRLEDMVWRRLLRLGADPRLVEAEVTAMAPVVVAKTANRSVLGFMNEYGYQVEAYMDEQYGGPRGLHEVEARLEDNPCHAGKTGNACFWPRERTLELLKARWTQQDIAGQPY